MDNFLYLIYKVFNLKYHSEYDIVLDMFLRIKKVPNSDGSKREYLCLVESCWEKGKVKQRNVATLGRLDILKQGNTLENMTRKLAEFVEKLSVLDLANDLEIENSQLFGPVVIYRKLWERLGFGEILKKYFRDNQVKFDISEAVLAMVLNRLIAPGSKREVNRWKEEVYETKWEGLDLQHFYRAMDYLVEKKEKFEVALFGQAVDMFNLDVNLVLFDTTSIMSWSEGEHSKILKHGYSKEKRGDLKQIMVGVLMTKEGIPVGHEVWEGNQSDKKSMVAMIDKVKEKHQLGKVIFVGDRGMISAKILRYLEDIGYEYILGVPMRKLDKNKRHYLLKEADGTIGNEIPEYELVKATKESRLYAKEIIWEEGDLAQRYIVCYNPKEAELEAKKRKYFKELLKNKAEFSTIKDWVIKNGYKKYIKITGKNGTEVNIDIDEEKFKKEAVYDGKWVLTTNTNLEAKDIALYYKSLSQVEQGFRDLKSEIKTDPMYHWTTKRIRAHVFICFLALLLKLSLKRQLKESGSDLDFSLAMKEINRIRVTQVIAKGKAVLVRSNLTDPALKLFRALRISIPKRILNSQNLVTTPC